LGLLLQTLPHFQFGSRGLEGYFLFTMDSFSTYPFSASCLAPVPEAVHSPFIQRIIIQQRLEIRPWIQWLRGISPLFLSGPRVSSIAPTLFPDYYLLPQILLPRSQGSMSDLEDTLIVLTGLELYKGSHNWE
jgi:hypothetical protein